MNKLCFRCHERPGMHPRWDGKTGTVPFCDVCQQASLAKAAAYQASSDRLAGEWECPEGDWLVVMVGSDEWIGSAAAVELATDQLVDHVLVRHPDRDIVLDPIPATRVYDVVDEGVLA